jgi:hypothetical protein
MQKVQKDFTLKAYVRKNTALTLYSNAKDHNCPYIKTNVDDMPRIIMWLHMHIRETTDADLKDIIFVEREGFNANKEA